MTVIQNAIYHGVLLTGCGKKSVENTTPESTQTSNQQASTVKENPYKDEVKLTWYYVNGASQDEKMVYDKFNEVLKEKINTTVDFQRFDSVTRNFGARLKI